MTDSYHVPRSFSVGGKEYYSYICFDALKSYSIRSDAAKENGLYDLYGRYVGDVSVVECAVWWQPFGDTVGAAISQARGRPIDEIKEILRRHSYFYGRHSLGRVYFIFSDNVLYKIDFSVYTDSSSGAPADRKLVEVGPGHETNLCGMSPAAFAKCEFVKMLQKSIDGATAKQRAHEDVTKDLGGAAYVLENGKFVDRYSEMVAELQTQVQNYKPWYKRLFDK